MAAGQKTIREIKEIIQSSSDLDPILEEFKKDERIGVQKLLKQCEQAHLKRVKEREEFNVLTKYEQEIRKEGYSYIAGIDEVGRGPLAGPVVAAAVILPEDFYLPGLNDSKKLSEARREEFYEYIKEHATSIGVGMIHADEIDSINIFEATKKAMYEALINLEVMPEYLLIDAMKIHSPFPSQSIIKGDSKSISIAAASIIAKVTRDRLMKEYAGTFPGYSFEKNAGYGTKDHLSGLEKFGVTPIHRKSFAPVKDLLSVKKIE
ncbi:ribonuclease HII [Rossellomorea aquimaris]|nr:ribonuclease HII [Rossellomorea aquimaris]